VQLAYSPVVRITMRALVILCLIAATAGAEVTPILDSEPVVQPLPRLSASVGVMGTGGKLAGLDLTGWAPNVELALGSGRWQRPRRSPVHPDRHPTREDRSERDGDNALALLG
jgi:hypothetical protein